MNLDDYQSAALRTASTRVSGVPEDKEREALAFAYAALGVGGEAGELVGAIKKFLYQGRDFVETRGHVKDEIGDVLWYLSWIADLFKLDLRTCAVANIEKLKKRYPHKFTPDGGIR